MVDGFNHAGQGYPGQYAEQALFWVQAGHTISIGGTV
jgi:hypothetical protein